MIAEVAFNLPLERTFHYLVPPSLQPSMQPGVRVIVPFGHRQLTGCVVRLPQSSPIQQLKAVRRILDPVPVIDGERWPLASWLSGYYGCSVGEALAAMVPSGLRLHGGGDSAATSNQQPATGQEQETLTLTRHQEAALKTIIAALDASTSKTLLLHGVTASGKTELYLRAIAHVLQQGRSAICLIPEIALTPQTIDRFRARFGEQVAVWHSRLTAAQRSRAWTRMVSGECRIVVGARSAVFAPVLRPGLIILDEEQEGAYKQEDAPRYHAREVAKARARLSGAAVLLGSATPSVESFYEAGRPGGTLISLPERVRGRLLPEVEIIDMRQAWGSRRSAGGLSPRLQRFLEQTVSRGEQALLFLNRRGFARTAQCKTCGTVMRCTYCAVPLIYHANRKALLCHYCNFQEPLREMCPSCRKGYLRFRGSGTERVESELHRLFPTSSIVRMDRDTTKARESHRQIYEAVKGGSVNLLVGTQMIAKGLDFPQVTLVGVVSADTSLNLPDFRAGERTFDLLTQVAGRAGRGDQPGRVLIQTYCPDHYAILAARRHDYDRFFGEELAMRRRLRLPPFVRLVELTVIGASSQRVHESADALGERLRRSAKGRGITVLGPAPHRVPRLRRAYRVCLLLRGRRVEPMVALVRGVLEPGRKFRGAPVLVNVDPL
jgi:primosomal protein N' (replication factor Y)